MSIGMLFPIVMLIISFIYVFGIYDEWFKLAWEFLQPIFFAGLTTLALWWTFRSLAKARMVYDAPTSKVRSASQGYIELEGIAKRGPSGLLCSPLSNQPCVWYKYEVVKKVGSGKYASVRVVENERSAAHFILDDGTEQCHIDPADADISAVHYRWCKGGSAKPLNVPLTSELTRWERFFLSMGGGSYTYVERCILEGEPLYAIGSFKTLNNPRQIRRFRARNIPDKKTLYNGKEESSLAFQNSNVMENLLTSGKYDRKELVDRFDLNDDGELDYNEWQTIREAAAQESWYPLKSNVKGVNSTPSKRTYDVNVLHTMSRSSVHRQPFIIATTSPKRLMSMYREKVIVGLILVAGLSVCTYLSI